MSYSQLLQVIAATCLVAVPTGWVLGRVLRRLLAVWRRFGARPRHLQSRGVRRRASVPPSSSHHAE
jgi:cellulose biosynthesis operon protein BcsF/YhjT